MLKERGITDEDIQTIMVDNPSKALRIRESR